MLNTDYTQMLNRLSRVRELLNQHPAAQDPRAAEAL